MKKLSVIIPTHNGSVVLEKCLQSLEKQTFRDFETVVLDNGSTDGTSTLLSGSFTWAGRFAFETNRGFAFPVNEGIRNTEAPYVLLLNNDTVLPENFLAESLSFLERCPSDVAAANPLVLLEDGLTIDNFGIYLFDRWRAGQIGWKLAKERAPADPVEVFGANACATLYRRSFFEDVGLFDEHFFAYFEDVDLSIRGRLRGWRFLHNPQATVRHCHSYTSAKLGDIKYGLVERNYFFYVLKNAPLKMVFRLLGYRHLLRDLGNVLHYLKSPAGRKDWERRRAVYGILKEHWRWLLKSRRLVRKSVKQEIDGWINVECRDFSPGGPRPVSLH